jgi:indolepyruvate ferredoxin oxidoreductase beta subunit
MSIRTSCDIVLAGRGGQGVIFLSRVMGQAALIQGLGVRTTETHGMAMRGGSVNCFVRIGKMMGSLVRKGTADLLIALHRDEAWANLSFLGPEGMVIINRDEKDPQVSIDGDRVLAVDANGIARELGNLRSANLALLGGILSRVERFPLEAAAIEEAIAMSGPEKAVEKNLAVFRKGLIAS